MSADPAGQERAKADALHEQPQVWQHVLELLVVDVTAVVAVVLAKCLGGSARLSGEARSRIAAARPQRQTSSGVIDDLPPPVPAAATSSSAAPAFATEEAISCQFTGAYGGGEWPPSNRPFLAAYATKVRRPKHPSLCACRADVHVAAETRC